MKYLSLFSGIGGFELGIKQAYENIQTRQHISKQGSGGGSCGRLGGESNNSFRQEGRDSEHADCIGFSEIDKYATEIYQTHFPNHKNYGDITKINPEELPDFDLLVGGFPCQAFSIAGKRQGFMDTRGTLFFEIARIIREKQPRLLLLENVKGLLSHDKGATFHTIIATLDELGYDIQWQVLNSKNHGVPQNRERVFIIGHLRGTPRPKVFPFGGTDKEADKTKKLSEPISNCLRTNYSNGKSNETYIRQVDKEKTTLLGGSPNNSLQKVSCNNNTTINQLNQPKHSNDRVYGKDGLSPTLNTAQGGNRQPFVATRNDGMEVEMTEANAVTPDAYLTSGKRKRVNRKPELTSMYDRRIRRLTPKECERLQGFPDGWTEGVSDTQRYKTLGNAVTVNVIKDICERLLW